MIDSASRTTTSKYNLFVGVSPSPMFDKGVTVEMQNLTSGLGPSSVLYTARGSQGSSLDGAWITGEKYMGLDINNYKNVVTLRTTTDD